MVAKFLPPAAAKAGGVSLSAMRCGNRLPASLRLKSKIRIQQIYTRGRRIHGRTLNILYLPSDQTRMAVTIGRKTGNAVYRNRQKRRVREFFRTHKSLFPAVDVIFHIKKLASEPSYGQYAEDILRMIPHLKPRDRHSVRSDGSSTQ